MAGGYATPNRDSLDHLITELRDAKRRLAELERPTGTQLASAVAQLEALVLELQAQVDDLLAVAVNTGDVNATGHGHFGTDVTGTTGTFPDGLNSVDVYSHLVTGGGSYRATWTHEDGTLGYAPSSARFKRDITDATLDTAKILELEPVTFRYKDAVANVADAAETHLGLIAEQLHDLSLAWLVDYDSEGNPFGVKYELLALALLPVLKAQEARIVALEAASNA